MIVVAICGILAAIAVPQFAQLLAKSEWRKSESSQSFDDWYRTKHPVSKGTALKPCDGHPVSITVDDYYRYTLFDSGCVDKSIK